MDCFGTYFTHAQSCDNVRVPSATEWTASVHTLHMPKAVITFVFQVLLGTCSICAFSRFPVFAFSRFRVWFSRFRVFVFSCLVFAFSRFAAGIPGAEPHISYAQHFQVTCLISSAWNLMAIHVGRNGWKSIG